MAGSLVPGLLPGAGTGGRSQLVERLGSVVLWAQCMPPSGSDVGEEVSDEQGCLATSRLLAVRVNETGHF